MIDLRTAIPYLQQLYSDEMDITSTEKVKNGNTVANVYPQEPQQVGIPCRISFPGYDTISKKTDPYDPISLKPKIFCNPDVEIKAGDRISIRRKYPDGTIYASFDGLVSISGYPKRYSSHLEFEIDMEGTP